MNVGYEKRQSIENAGSIVKQARKMKKQTKISRERKGDQAELDTTSGGPMRSKTNDGRSVQAQPVTSQHSNYGPCFPQTSTSTSKAQTIQINNPISIYHVYFTQQSQRASLDLKKKLEPFEKSYLKYQKKMMKDQGRYANTIDYTSDQYEGSGTQERSAVTFSQEEKQYQTISHNGELDPDSRGRSLPPLRAQNHGI